MAKKKATKKGKCVTNRFSDRMLPKKSKKTRIT
jgi:hypothetical protein